MNLRGGNHGQLGRWQQRAVCLSLLVLIPRIAHAQPATDACNGEPLRISQQALIDFPAAYAAIASRATAWRTDARLVKAGHSFGNVDSEGRSRRWNIEYLSAGTAHAVTFYVDRGMISCQDGPSGQVRYVPDLKPKFVTDLKQVLAVAALHGGSELLAKGYVPSVHLRTSMRQYKFEFRSTRAVWGVSYLRPYRTKDGEGQIADSDSIYVMIDANTGDFISATAADAWWKFWRSG